MTHRSLVLSLAALLQLLANVPVQAGEPVRALATGLSESLHARAEYPMQSPKPRERSRRAREARLPQGGGDSSGPRPERRIEMGPKFTNIEAVPLFSIFF
jgi:hypothetical protein